MNAKINDTLEDSMTVEELIQELQGMPATARVVFSCDYGDICHTQQALLIKSAAQLYPDTDRIVETGYSNSGIAVEEDFAGNDPDAGENEDYSDDAETDEDEQIEVVVLRAEYR